MPDHPHDWLANPPRPDMTRREARRYSRQLDQTDRILERDPANTPMTAPWWVVSIVLLIVVGYAVVVAVALRGL